MLADSLPAHGKDEIKIFARHMANRKMIKYHYVDEDKVKIEREVLTLLVIQQKHPTDNMYTLWKIISEYHRDLVPTISKLAELTHTAPLQTVRKTVKETVREGSPHRMTLNHLIEIDRQTHENFSEQDQCCRLQLKKGCKRVESR